MAVAERKGIIVRVNDSAGFGYVQEENSTRQFIFGFDKVRGYQGQPASCGCVMAYVFTFSSKMKSSGM
jgi:hypothetical protein